MNKIEEALWHDYNEVSSRMKTMSKDSDEYKEAVQERDNLRNEMIKLEQLKKDTNVKVSQIQAENRREKIRNLVNILTFAANGIICIWGVKKTFKFDETSTVTSTQGRNMLNNVVPKLFNGKR